MALSSQNSPSPPLSPSEDSPERTYSLNRESSVNDTGEDVPEADLSKHQDYRQEDVAPDVGINVEGVTDRQDDGSQSTNLRETREESNCEDDAKGGSGVETDSVDYDDGESEILHECRDGSVSPSYSSLRVEPDLEDSQSHLRLQEIFEGDGSASESGVDLANLSEPFAVSELELIERALRNLRHSQKHGMRGTADSADGETDDAEVDERRPLSPVSGVSRLLMKVQAVSAQKKRNALVTGLRDNNLSPRARSISATGDQDLDFADMRQLIQAASRAAFSTAKAAEAMVNSMDRNSQAIERLCKTLTCTSGEGASVKENEGGAEDKVDINSQLLQLQQSELDMELRQAEITKNVLRQNRVTHWVLGFIIVSTFAWRFGVVKFVRRVNNAVSNPFQGITGVFDQFKGEKKNESGNKGLKLPSILAGDSDEDKDAELPFNLGKILPHAGTDTEIQASASAHTHGTGSNTDGLFNLGKLLQVGGDATDDEQ